MNKISIKHFKAFNEVEIDNLSSSMLIYGENGAGKSSLYDALSLIFYHTKIEESIPANYIGKNREQKIHQRYLIYNNKKDKMDFELQVDGTKFRDFDASPYDAFLISTSDIKGKTSLNVQDLFSHLYVPTRDDVDLYSRETLELIVLHVNTVLRDVFLDSVTIDLNQTGDYFYVKDDAEGIPAQQMNLDAYYNEAKINIIVFVIVMSAIELLVRPKLTKKYRYLVLDDIVTSFDSANRIFFIRYIQQHFSKFTKIILTHNINFYNLFKYAVSDNIVNNSLAESWQFINVYTCGGIHKILSNKQSSLEDIKKQWETEPWNNYDVGNKIRQRFEMLVYELGKKMHLGAIGEAKVLLDQLYRNEPLYLIKSNQPKHPEPLTIYDMVKDIVRCSSIRDSSEYQIKVKKILSKYKATKDLQKLKPYLSEVVMYQKAALHPASHGHTDLPPFTDSEIERSLLLLEKLEAIVKRSVEHIGAL